MPTVRFQVTTDLPPDRVLGVLTDFSDRRPDVWPNIDHAHFRVHGQGPGWADVTEGNVLAWERNSYQWNAAAGEVTVTAVESDTWAPGSQWRYRLQPTATGGTQADVTVVRTGRGPRGLVIGAFITWFGRRILRSNMEKVLARIR
ncbi:MAG TPA: SRPBCC family protein [Candidatus Dormibacteraeota bacterium]|nr:SRPBCC family protein [Candidatus Dormibacteraeota bacterium]